MGFALLDLLDYWVNAPGSISPDNPERTFWFAVRRAVWMATQFLVQAHNRQGDSLDEMVENGREPVTPFDPDEGLLEEEARAFATTVRARLTEQHRDWLDGLAEGLTVRDEAAERGVTHQAISTRRRVATQEARDIASDEGLL